MINLPVSLRIMLLVCALLVFAFVLRKLRRAQMQVLDSLFWLLFSVSFVILGIFPQVAIWLSGLFGFKQHLKA